MNKPTPNKAFNAACAEYMEFTVVDHHEGQKWAAPDVWYYLDGKPAWKKNRYFPDEDANQLLPVVDKIVKNETFNYSLFPRIMTFYRIGAEQALINFVSQALNIEATNES